jgi:hypothetical protein
MDIVANIGDNYSEILGYKEAVGSMGIIGTAMSALVEVQIITGEMSGKVVDIHKQDILIDHVSEPAYLCIADYDLNRFYFTRSKRKFNFILDDFGWCSSFRTHSYVNIDKMILQYSKFTFHDLDSDMDNATKEFPNAFEEKITNSQEI